MAKRFGNQNKCLSAMVALMLIIALGTALVGIAITKPHFNITQNINLSEIIGRSDLNGSDWFNATTSQQPVQLIPSIVQQPLEGELPGPQGPELPAFLQGTSGSKSVQLPAFLQ